MKKSMAALAAALARLTQQARKQGLSDTVWAARAGVRKETLSRLRSRDTCDLATLAALASAVGMEVAVVPDVERTAAHFPHRVNRDYEDKLLELCLSRPLNAAQWQQLGPSFFMGGLAVMLASMAGLERRELLALAEHLHPGISEPAVFARWLKSSPVRPSRFLPQLDKAIRRAA